MPREWRVSPGMWVGIAVIYAFFGLLAYHLFLQHRAHVMGSLVYVAILVLVPLGYLAIRRAIRARPR